MNILKKVRLKYRMDYLESFTFEGVKLNHRHPLLDYTMRRFICRERYELDELKALKNTLNANDRVLELGTCLRFISTFAAKICGSDNVVTVEANPELLDLISETYKNNNVNPKIIHGVASDFDADSVDFYVSKTVFSSAEHEQDNTKKVVVPSVNVNRLIDEHNANYLIIDIEGGEAALVPALNLERVEKLLIEVHPQKIGACASSIVLENIIAKGFIFDFKNSYIKDDVFTCLFIKPA